ncbi:OmpA family protein [Lacinutrix neustonica]|uniref:OmpA family protein n=1 Tax=Lacinutrix neustonica TaxID=2980107 RepID=A0A9E8MYX6_9FLAO|nr:OmpA family protein [Lacinutrix neustonica]WAC03445.1 OmpA family protein [Lacinutrix neustonica]
MKILKKTILVSLLLMGTMSHAQIWKKLGKKAEKAAERTIERRVERETEKSTNRTLDTLIEAPKKSKREKRGNRKKNRDKEFSIGGTSSDSENSSNTKSRPQVHSNFDFKAGDVVLFEDNFSKDNIGDFPAEWDTNGSGEIVMIDGEKWFRLANKSMFLPMTSQKLPENYTIDFDLLTTGLDNKTSSQAMLTLFLSNNNKYDKGKNWCMVELSPCQFIDSRGSIEKVNNGSREMRNEIDKDYRNSIKGASKISIEVNKTRMRVWLNENKIVDTPRLVPDGITNFKIGTRGLRDDRNFDEIHINNFRIAKTGQDHRSKLLTEGKLSTNAILFNTGSATIKSGSEAILKEVGEAMQSVPDMRILIIGHTDSDGNLVKNQKLSEERAKSVRSALVTKFGINSARIQTEGKGASNPIADNSSATGKEQNRRVEFLKL